MQKNEKLIGMLNDLIKINNDRFEGYKSLLANKTDLHKEFRILVLNMANQSRAFTSALIGEAIKLRTQENTGASFTASLYRSTMGLNKPFSDLSEEALIAACRNREELVQKAYYDAISISTEVPDRILNMISDQKHEMKITGSLMKVPAGMHHAVAA